LLIVEDPTGSLPAEIEALEELDFVLLHLNMPELTAVSVAYQNNCEGLGGTTAECADSIWAPGATSGRQTNSVLVNGMTVTYLSILAWIIYLSVYNLHKTYDSYEWYIKCYFFRSPSSLVADCWYLQK